MCRWFRWRASWCRRGRGSPERCCPGGIRRSELFLLAGLGRFLGWTGCPCPRLLWAGSRLPRVRSCGKVVDVGREDGEFARGDSLQVGDDGAEYRDGMSLGGLVDHFGDVVIGAQRSGGGAAEDNDIRRGGL